MDTDCEVDESPDTGRPAPMETLITKSPVLSPEGYGRSVRLLRYDVIPFTGTLDDRPVFCPFMSMVVANLCTCRK